jgi:hypothetical protein
MKRLSFAMLSILAASTLTGCCCPGSNWFAPWGGGCGTGQCGVQPHGAVYGQGGPTAYYGYEGVQTASPVIGQPIAMPMQTYPGVALESLPTYR